MSFRSVRFFRKSVKAKLRGPNLRSHLKQTGEKTFKLYPVQKAGKPKQPVVEVLGTPETLTK